MSQNTDPEPTEFLELPSEESGESAPIRYEDVVVHATDWTAETVVSQVQKGNIQLNPRFQRRDAWDCRRKSKFIESLVLGLPIPQIVLAESAERRGSFVVLDGKQRLLSLIQFWGQGTGANNCYKLTGLDVLGATLGGKTYRDLESDATLLNELTALQNQPIRTVVIKNWPDLNFLHLVFLRLNAGSVKLSPQELRQALIPGLFTNFVDDRSVKSAPLRRLLGLHEPDYRMRDVELLARHLAFRMRIEAYEGRMKSFIDETFRRVNLAWSNLENDVTNAVDEFDAGLTALMEVFPKVARKPGSTQLNRAVLDALLFYACNPLIRNEMLRHADEVRRAYQDVFDDPKFVAAVERDTASALNTAFRLERWGDALGLAVGLRFQTPKLVNGAIRFSGF